MVCLHRIIVLGNSTFKVTDKIALRRYTSGKKLDWWKRQGLDRRVAVEEPDFKERGKGVLTALPAIGHNQETYEGFPRWFLQW